MGVCIIVYSCYFFVTFSNEHFEHFTNIKINLDYRISTYVHKVKSMLENFTKTQTAP